MRGSPQLFHNRSCFVPAAKVKRHISHSLYFLERDKSPLRGYEAPLNIFLRLFPVGEETPPSPPRRRGIIIPAGSFTSASLPTSIPPEKSPPRMMELAIDFERCDFTESSFLLCDSVDFDLSNYFIIYNI